MDPTTLYRAIGFFSTLFFVFMAVVTVLTFRKTRKTSARSMIFTVIMSVAVLAIYGIFTDTGLSATSGGLLLLAGTVIGVVWSQATRAFRDRTGRTVTKNTVWYLLVWAFFVSLNQMTVLFSMESAVYSLALLALTTGSAIGMNGSIIVKLGALSGPMTSPPGAAVSAPSASRVSTQAPLFCRHCGVRLEGSDPFCRECGGRVG